MQFPDDWSGFGPKVQALRDRERRFVWAYLINSMTEIGANGAQSARDAGYSDASEGAKVRAHHLLHRTDVQDAIQELAARELRGLALPALAALGSILKKPDHPDRQKVALSILSRVGLAEQAGINLQVSGSVQVNHTDEALEELAILMRLGVPREKLLETFGFSGLTRYEKMLAEREARSPKLIEGEVVSREPTA
jgi:hypothetical protein